tara:strand:- start:10680 stop:10886 length:207 start_codon:yes stop_codon:yes gene_type:complete
MDVSAIIAALGGNKAVADLFGVLPSAVSNWKAAGRFPDRLHLRVFLECQSRGVSVPPELLSTTSRNAA